MKIRAYIAVLAACVLNIAACMPPAIEKAAAEDSFSAGFLVSFEPWHAMGHAQALQNAGQHDAAQRLAEATLQHDPALQGWCFERFTIGGAEMLLRSCTPNKAARDAQQRRLDRLIAIPGVLYAEPNSAGQADL